MSHVPRSGIGDFSIEFTAKDGTIGPDGGAKCLTQGMCNPKITFYRNGYQLILKTWETVYEGNDYTGARSGLCQGGVLTAAGKGGETMGYT